MGINKVIALLLTTIVVVSCNRPSQEAYNDLMRDNQQLKQKLEATQTKSFEQAEAMSRAMEELAKISGRTLILRMDVENGRGRMRDVEQMSFQLNAVKEKLNQLEKLAEQGEAQRKMVRELRKMIVDKEKEIANLKQLIKDKDKQIKEQQQTIEKQHNTIATQKKESSQQATTILMQEFQLQELVTSTFTVTSLEEPKFAFLNSELHILHITVVIFKFSLESIEFSIDFRHSLFH